MIDGGCWVQCFLIALVAAVICSVSHADIVIGPASLVAEAKLARLGTLHQPDVVTLKAFCCVCAWRCVRLQGSRDASGAAAGDEPLVVEACMTSLMSSHSLVFCFVCVCPCRAAETRLALLLVMSCWWWELA
jgi:hypothetical protein